MSEADAEIVFKAKIDAEDFNKDIERLSSLLKEKKSQIDNLKQAYSNLSSGKTKPQEQIRLEKKLNSLLEKRKDISDSLDFKKVSKTSQDTLVTQLNDINRQIPKVQNALDKIKIKPTSAQSVKDLARELNLAEKEAIKLSNALNQSKGILGATQLKQAKEATRLENKIIEMEKKKQDKIKVNAAKAAAAAKIARERIRSREAINAQNRASRESMFAARMAERRKKDQERKKEKEDRKKARDEEKFSKQLALAEKKSARIYEKQQREQARAEEKAAREKERQRREQQKEQIRAEKNAAREKERQRREQQRAEEKEAREKEKEAREYEKQQREMQKAAERSVREQIKLSQRLTREVEREQREQAKAEEKEAARAAKERTKLEELEATKREKLHQNILKVYGFISSKLLSTIKLISKGILKGISTPINILKSAFVGLISPIGFAISKIIEFGKRILRIGSYVLVFNLIRKGFQQLRDYISDALQTNDSFVNSLNQIKSNLMVAFYPIYQYILPAINALISTLVKASAYLAQFVSMILGKDISQSQAGAKALYEKTQAVKDNTDANKENADSIKDERAEFDKLGKSIKGGKKELASFDKLNVLNPEKNKKNKKNKKDNFVFSPTTAFDPTYDKIVNIFEELRKKISPILEDLATKLEPLKQKFKDLGETVKDTFLKYGIPAIQDFYNEFAKPFGDWVLGEGLPRFAEITKNMIKDIDWDKLNASLKDFWKALEPFAEHVGEGLLWFYENVLAKFAIWTMSEGLPEFLRITTDLLNNIDWDTLNQSLGDFWKELEKFAEERIGQGLLWFYENVLSKFALFTINEAIPRFANILTRLIKETDWDKLSEALKDLSNRLEPFAEDIGKGLLWFLENVLEPLAKWTIGDFIPAFINALNGALDVIKPVIETVGDMLVKFYDNFLKPVGEWTGGKIVDILNGIGEKLKPLGEWLDHNRWFIEMAVGFLIGVGAALTGIGIAGWVASGGLTATATSLFAAAKGAWAFTAGLLSNPLTWIVVGIGLLVAALVGLITHWDDIKAWFKENFPKMLDWAKGFINGLVSGFEWVVNQIISSLNWLTGKLNSFQFDLPDWLGGGHFGINIPEIPEYHVNKTNQIPAFAQGAVLKGGNPILAYLNDQPRGQVNIETPLDTMIQAFKTALNSNEASYNNNITIQANGDLNSIISLLDFKIKQNNQRVGTNYVTGDVWI